MARVGSIRYCSREFISKWFWESAVRHELRSAGRVLALLGGLLTILVGLLGSIPPAIGLIVGAGAIFFSGQLKHTTWGAAVLLGGLLVSFAAAGPIGLGGGMLLVLAAALGIGSNFI